MPQQARIRALENIPEVKCIEQIDGACDLLVQIEAPVRAVFTALKVKAFDWVEHLSMLKVEPFTAIGQQQLVIHRVTESPEMAESQIVAKAEQYLAGVVAKR